MEWILRLVYYLLEDESVRWLELVVNSEAYMKQTVYDRYGVCGCCAVIGTGLVIILPARGKGVVDGLSVLDLNQL